MKKYIITLIIIMFSTYGCVFTKYNINHSLSLDNITTLVKKETPKFCNYRGKANVTLKGEQKISFTILLSKKCNDEVLINVLGALNNPVASKENTEEIKRIADNSIFHIISFFKTPRALPDENSKLSFSNSSYIFTDKSGDKIYADDKFRIYKYTTGQVETIYEWDREKDILYSIQVASPSGYVNIKFLNKSGWSDKDEQ